MSRHRKRPTVMPEGASYGTAREGNQTSERPIGSTSKRGAEPRVWTERMLAALAKGVKACPRAGRRPDPWGGKWYSLIDKVYRGCQISCVSTSRETLYLLGGSRHDTFDQG